MTYQHDSADPTNEINLNQPPDSLKAKTIDPIQNEIHTAELRSAKFRSQRENDWKRLEELVIQVEKKGVRSLKFEEARELAVTYRQTINALSVAREILLDQALLQYLENLSARAYLVVYAPQSSIRKLVSTLFIKGMPQAVRRCRLPLFIGFIAMILGCLLGYFLYQQDQSWFYTIMPSDLSESRTPEATRESLKGTIFDGATDAKNALAAFGSYLFSHNTQIAILIFSLGIFFAAPSFILTFYNGIILGVFFALFENKNLGYDMFAWLSIHGVTELSAICIACAGGAQLGLAVLNPGEYTRVDALRLRGRDATKLLLLAGFMLLIAAILEGFFRQKIQSSELRLLIGWGVGVVWVLWLTMSGREQSENKFRDNKGLQV